jgi:hypothetical protein
MAETLNATQFSVPPFDDRKNYAQLAPNVFARRDRIEAVKAALAQRGKR